MSQLDFLSGERCAYLLKHCKDDEHAIAVHHQAAKAAAAMMPVLGLVEISLRNSIDKHLTAHLGTPDWLVGQVASSNFRDGEIKLLDRARKSAQRAAYAKLGGAAKRNLDSVAFPNGVPNGITHAQRSKGRQAAINITRGQHISQLTIFFWKRLFSKDYESSLWKKTLKRVFPSKNITRSDVSENLEKIYVIRNRIAHHELCLCRHYAGVNEAIFFVSSNLMNVPNTDHPSPLDELLSVHISELETTLEKLRAIEPGKP